MYKWYLLYSYWIIILAILYKLNIVKFNVYPAVLFCLIFTVLIIFIRLKNNINMSTDYIIFTLVLHTFPLFLIPHTINFNDLIENLLLLFLYVTFMNLSGKNVKEIYKTGFYIDGNKNFYEIFKGRGLI